MENNFNNKINNNKNKNLSSQENTNINTVITPQNQNPFNYLLIDNNNFIIYNINNSSENSEFKQYENGKYQFVIGILLDSDFFDESLKLNTTLEAIMKNINNLSLLKIKEENILICIFISQINFLFKRFNNLILDNNELLILDCQSVYNKNISIKIIGKKIFSYKIDLIRFFYNNIIKDLIFEKNTIYTSLISNGVIPSDNLFYNLMIAGYDKKENNFISIPYIDYLYENTIGQLKNYENLNFNIYDLNYYDFSCTVPLTSKVNLMKIDEVLLKNISLFYNKTKSNSRITYHDYSLALYLYNMGFDIDFVKNQKAQIYLKEISFCEYIQNFIERESGIYGNFFQLLSTLFNFSRCNLFKKLILLFQILGMIFQFIYPSLSTMVVYSIFYEFLNIFDGRSAFFFTMIYLLFLLMCGTIFSKYSKINKTEFISSILLILFTIYYIFILVSSVFAMHHIKKNKNHNRYKFKKPAIIFLMLLIIIPAILPLIFKINLIISNILGMIYYLIIGVPTTNTIVLMGTLFNAPDSSGGNSAYDKKSLFIFLFYLFNIFFGHLILYMTDRTSRVNCVMILAIIFCIYNFVKIFGIIMNILFSENYESKIGNNELREEIKNYNQNISDNIKLKGKYKPRKKEKIINTRNNQNINDDYPNSNYNLINNNNNIENTIDASSRLEIIKNENSEKKTNKSKKFSNDYDKDNNKKHKIKTYLGYERPFPHKIEKERNVKTEVQSLNYNYLNNDNYDNITETNNNNTKKNFLSNNDNSNKNKLFESLSEPHFKNINKKSEDEFDYN